MSVKNEIISQCLNLVSQIVEKNMNIYMNVQIGEGISFVFDNVIKKSKSPSQKKRNIERALNFKQKVEEHKNDTLEKAQAKLEVKSETKKIETKVDDAKVETKEILCESIMLDRPTLFENEKKVENDLNEYLEAKGIGVKKVIFIRDASRDLKRIEIRINQMEKGKIEEAKIEFRDCKILWMR